MESIKEFLFTFLKKIEIIDSYESIDLMSREESAIIKEKTLQKDACEKLGFRNYIYNLLKIYKYQVETHAPLDKVQNKTLFNIGKALATEYTDMGPKIYVYLGIICLKTYLNLYGALKIERISDLDDEGENSSDQQSGDYSRIRSNFGSAYWKLKGSEPDKGEKILFDLEYNEIVKIIYNTIGAEIREDLYKIAPNNGVTYFSIIYVAHYDFQQHIDEDILARALYSSYVFSSSNTPLVKQDYRFIEDFIAKCKLPIKQKNTDKSEVYIDVSLDSALLNIIKQKRDYSTTLDYLKKFKNKYFYIYHSLNTQNKAKIRNIKQGEEEYLRNKALYFEMLESITTIKYLLTQLNIKDLRPLFDYLNHNLKQTLWYNTFSFINDTDAKKRYTVIELSRIFLYQRITSKEFNWLHSIYEQTIGDEPLLKRIYNLVLGKFSLAFIKIGVNYFTEGYNILLKQMFKNFWLQQEDQDLEHFNLPKEAGNDQGIYEINNESDIREFIFSDEGIDIEMKASIEFDWKTFLDKGEKKKLSEHSYLKPLVSLLNTKGGIIVVGIREKHKVEEALTSGDIKINLLKENGINKYTKANDHYLTGIENDLNIGGKVKDIDTLKQQIDQQIQEHIYPNPFTNNNPINVSVKKFLGKDICLIEVPLGTTEYYMAQKDAAGNKTFNLYVRKNASDHKISGAREIIEYYKSRNQQTNNQT